MTKRRSPPRPPVATRDRGPRISTLTGTLGPRVERAGVVTYQIGRTAQVVGPDADRVLRLARPGADVTLTFADTVFRAATFEEVVGSREIESPARYNEETGKEREAATYEVPILRTRRVEGGKVVSTYRAELPPGMKGRPFEIGDDDRQAFAAALAAAVTDFARQEHGSGGAEYREQHFAGLFRGTMYADHSTEQRGESQIVGTFARTDLEKVSAELASRIEATLEGQAPGPTGDGAAGGGRKGYGYFSAGPQEVAMMVTETLDMLEALLGEEGD
ncbi:hypothetical protein LLG88_00360 [bacterium]|nr:hypothetical protein [bacterium]